MSRASENEDRRIMAERVASRCQALIDCGAGAFHLTVVAGLLTGAAETIESDRRRGWQSAAREYRSAAGILAAWSAEVEAHVLADKPPLRPPLTEIPRHHHADLDPADGPVSAQISDRFVTPDVAQQIREASTVDDKLQVAFGPKTPVHPALRNPSLFGGYNVGAGCACVLTASDDPETPNVDDSACPLHNDVLRLRVDSLGLPDGVPPPAMVRPQAIEPDFSTVKGPADVSNIEPEARTKLDSLVHPAPERFIALLDDPAADMPGAAPDWQARIDALSDVTMVLSGVLEPVVGFSEPGATPPGQRPRMTFAEVRAHGMERARGIDHRSYSQVSSFGECGVRYALSDLDSEPAWWLVGGTALHYACEAVNRRVVEYGIDPPPGSVTLVLLSELWSQNLGRAISETIAESGITPDRWKAAKKGSEGYDWWRINGAAMVEAWVARLRALYAQGWQIATWDDKPMIEVSLPMMIGDVKVENILDLVLYRSGTDEYLIIDYKSGASTPDSTVQLGQYGHALCEAVGRLRHIDCGVSAGYWMARTDTLDVIHDIPNVHPFDEIEYVITTMHQAESQGLYLPNRNRGWGGCKSCAVRDLCPVGPR